MAVLWYLVRVVIVAIIVVTVGGISRRNPRWGALLLSLPLVSILAFLVSWYQHKVLAVISRVARDTLILVPLSLPFFLPFAFAQRLGLIFWGSFGTGIGIVVIIIATWLYFSPQT